jgi:hypothetical protein
MALILPSSRRVESAKRWLMWSEVATTSSWLPNGSDPLVCTGHNAPPRRQRPAAASRRVSGPHAPSTFEWTEARP